jgi:release factor glutamine methyltransferase
MNDADSALVELGRTLRARGYRFVTVTPETHQRVVARDARLARDLRDVFGWSRPFLPELLPKEILELAGLAGIVRESATELRVEVRFSSIDDRLFVHSAFPTAARDAVFFGPDSYRFCAFVKRSLPRVGRLVDIGCGSGAGGLSAHGLAEQIVLADINPRALRFAAINAALAEQVVEIVESDVLDQVTGRVDGVVANPPYLNDALGRTYRDGGGSLGEGLSIRIVRDALARLAPGGTLVLYTGAAIVDGHDLLFYAVQSACEQAGATFAYEELDPDVFGSELEGGSYADVERIAAIGMVAKLPSAGSTV